jgi:hypothetical protein
MASGFGDHPPAISCLTEHIWKKWQELGDSNPRPSVLETDALPTELNSCSARYYRTNDMPLAAVGARGKYGFLKRLECERLKAHLVVNRANIAVPFAMITFEQPVGHRHLAGHNLS